MAIATEQVKLGISELSVPPGTHMCAFYRGIPERDAMFGPFIREGLRAGDKCLCAIDATDPMATVAELGAGVEPAPADGQLDFMSSKDIYLGRGDFTVPDMLGYWETWASTSLAVDGFSFARATGEMTWAVTEVIGVPQLIRYESELNRFVPRYPQVLLCLYDLDRLSGHLLVDIIKTHPKVLMGNTILENLYYVSPDELSTEL